MGLEMMTMEQLDLMIGLVEERMGLHQRVLDGLFQLKEAHTQKKTIIPNRAQEQNQNPEGYKYYASRDRIHKSIIALGVSSTVGEIKADLETRFRIKAKTSDIQALLKNNPGMIESVADDRWLAIRRPDDE